MIHLKDINKTYPGIVPLHVLKGINLDIEKGELVSIMGSSGSVEHQYPVLNYISYTHFLFKFLMYSTIGS